MLGLTDLKTGVAIVLNGDPHVVMSYQHSKVARGGAIMRTKLKNLKTGAIIDETFKGNEKFEEAPLERRNCSYLYAEADILHFMNSENFDQYEIPADIMGVGAQFLKEGCKVQILFFNDAPVSVDLPIKMEFEVTHTEPGVKGNTAQGGTKPATIETGATITVPLFIKIGDRIRVNTTDASYVERAKE